MKKNKKSILAGSLLAGALISTTTLTGNAGALFNYSDLGSGSEVRTALLENGSSTSSFIADMNCGDSTATKAADKSKEGKSGEKKSDKKAKKEGKSSEMKCGEGQCGEKTDKK